MSNTTDQITDFISGYLADCAKALARLEPASIVEVIGLLSEARHRGNQVFTCGNGGSASTASHLANDLGKGASLGNALRFRVLSLVDNVAWMTALANDTDYSRVFVEQLRNYARQKDILLAFSGSGDSKNVLAAVEWANKNGLITVGLTGRTGGQLKQLAMHPICIDSTHMGHIEEGHFILQHILSYYFMPREQEV